jgi:hypothetical protein
MINFVAAANKGLELLTSNDEVIAIHSVEHGVRVFAEQDFSDTLMLSSSMDFAIEEGFDTEDGAKMMLGEIIDAVNFATNAGDWA